MSQARRGDRLILILSAHGRFFADCGEIRNQGLIEGDEGDVTTLRQRDEEGVVNRMLMPDGQAEGG